MDIRNTYWVLSLSLLLSLSLTLPYCCHVDISDLFSHQQETSAHATHNSHSDGNAKSCDCGHEFVKDFQKTKKVVTGSNALPLLTGIVIDTFSFRLYDQAAVDLVAAQPGILADAGPPLHLLNSVFLN